MKANTNFNSILIENSPNPILVINKDNSIKYVNNALEKMTGYKSEDLIGLMPPYPWWKPEDAEEYTRHLNELMSVMHQGDMVERILRKRNGELFWVEITSKPIIINSKFEYFLSTWNIITQRKQAELALMETQEFNSSLLSNAPFPILVVNQDYSILYVNPALEELTGFSSSELIGKQAPFPWSSQANHNKYIRCLNDPRLKGKKLELKNHKQNGEEFWVQIITRSVVVNGEFRYLISNWVDITERKKTERELNKLNQELRNLSSHLQSVREKERAHISREVHDELGQALVALKMDACWIKENLKKDQNDIHKTTDSMLKLIEDTLQKVKWLSVGLRPRLLDDIGLAAAIRWLAQEFQKVTGIDFEIDVKLDDRKYDSECSTAVYRIVQEALSNVFRHAKATRVEIGLTCKGNVLQLKVADNGKGITPEQLSSPTALGILGIRERAHYFGGKVSIAGQNGKGTKLTVRIPFNGRK
jgi:two-component system sensor histidine kinase UhpB